MEAFGLIDLAEAILSFTANMQGDDDGRADYAPTSQRARDIETRANTFGASAQEGARDDQ